MKKIESFKEVIPSGSAQIFCEYSCNVKDPKAHIVILTGDGIQGSTSSTWPPLIKNLLDSDYAILVFDFVSQGYSSGERTMLTIGTGTTNFLDALDFFNNRLKIDRLVAIASSFGGAVLLSSKAILPMLDMIIFKSPVSDLVQSYECEHPGNEMSLWKERGVSPNTGLSYNAYLEALKCDLSLNVNLIKCQVVIFHGTADEIVPIVQSRHLKNIIGNNCRLLELPDVKHNYKQNDALRVFCDMTVDLLNNKYDEIS